MFKHEQLIHCQQHKAALLQQSAAHRLALTREAANLRPVASWVDLGFDLARKARSGWATVAPFLSLWATRKQESTGFIHKLAQAVSLARSVMTIWKNWR